jgi:hypothetical protein
MLFENRIESTLFALTCIPILALRRGGVGFVLNRPRFSAVIVYKRQCYQNFLFSGIDTHLIDGKHGYSLEFECLWTER